MEEREERKKREVLREAQRKKEEARAAAIEAGKVSRVQDNSLSSGHITDIPMYAVLVQSPHIKSMDALHTLVADSCFHKFFMHCNLLIRQGLNHENISSINHLWLWNLNWLIELNCSVDKPCLICRSQ